MGLLDRNDAPGEHAPSWYAESAHDFPRLLPLEESRRADVVIVGGGFTGLSAALHLAERGAEVVLLDAHRVGWGASGRNGGQVGVGQRVDQPDLERMIGLEAARAAWEIGRDAALLVRRLVMHHSIKCDLRTGLLYVNHRKRYDADSEAMADHMARVYGHHDVQYIPPAEMPRLLGAEGISGGTYDALGAHLHPLDYAHGLAHAAMKAGARLHEMSRVRSVETGKVTLASGAEVTADRVILACNGYHDGLVGEVAARVMPINNYVVATEPLREAEAHALIPSDAAVADSRFVVNYFRLSSDHRLLFGGGESYGDAFPADIRALVRPRMEKLFPSLRGVKLTHAWGGTLGITRTRLPMVEEVAPGVVSAGGYSGSGVAMGTMMGKVLAQLHLGDPARFEVMRSLPRPAFPGGPRFRRPTLVAAMLAAQLRDAL
ncbi:NAD(P)/FAD-dependent oxidoreductase [Rhodovulum sp. DZ06]|uniref:NAD(P)/FAD-dependent oxidoreductase n=1 Tax=Rhodovulum sp. DZ06 TaxID=3425126 RepID=UPI003D340D2D